MTEKGANDLPQEKQEELVDEKVPTTEAVEQQKEEKKPEEKAELSEDVLTETETAQAAEKETVVPETTETESENEATAKEVLEPVSAEADEKETSEKNEQIDYSTLGKEELVVAFKKLLAEQQIQEIKDDAEAIRAAFYKQLNTEIEQVRKKFLDDGGKMEDFEAPVSKIEEEFKEIYSSYKDKKAKYFEEIEAEKQRNVEEKLAVIKAVEELINSQEAINTTFQEFHALQERWKNVGQVPQTEVKPLWEKYHYTVEKFYDYIKINKELRDLDLRRNLESKIKLCERAEELLLEPSIVNSFKELQDLHAQWREIGPVPRDKKDEIWERFKLATTQINKAHQEYYEKLKEEQENNLKAKTVLCEKVEEINGQDFKSFKEWEDKANEVIEIQKIWKLIGFTPKKYNNDIYNRFRTSCDEFFAAKRDFYNAAKDEQKANLSAKMELVEQAEALKDSTDWKKTTEIYVGIQKKWKDIGPVPRKHSDAIWERFRSACNAFFDRKKQHFSSIDNEQGENLKKKEELIERIRTFEFSGDNEADLDSLKGFQNEWTEIGHVPYAEKDRVQKAFREEINQHFSKLRVDENVRQEMKFKSRLEDIKQSPKAKNKLRFERDKVIRKLQKVEKDIVTWENNIGFFSNSKNADALVRDVEQKIAKAREYAEQLRDKLELIDRSGDEED